MKVENHDTTKLGSQHKNLLKREIQRMWTIIKLFNDVHVIVLVLPHYTVIVVYYAYLLITKWLKILIFAHGGHKKKIMNCIQFYFIFAFS